MTDATMVLLTRCPYRAGIIQTHSYGVVSFEHTTWHVIHGVCACRCVGAAVRYRSDTSSGTECTTTGREVLLPFVLRPSASLQHPTLRTNPVDDADVPRRSTMLVQSGAPGVVKYLEWYLCCHRERWCTATLIPRDDCPGTLVESPEFDYTYWRAIHRGGR